jgi:uncharacterized protein involved in exopolysaccharide biosynthesis
MAGNGNMQESAGARRKSGTELREVVFVLYRRRWIMLAIALPIILAGGLNLLGRAGTFTAASRVLVELSTVDQPRWNTQGRSIDYDRELSTFINIGLSVSVAELAAEALADSLPAIRARDPKLAELQPGVEFRDYLLGGLDVNVVGESSILEFRFTAENAEVALMASGALRDAFIHYENTGRRKPGALAYYTEQVDQVRGAIDSLLAVRAEVLNQSLFTSLEDELGYSTGASADAREKLREAQVDRVQLETEYALLKSFLDKDPRDFPMGQDESRSSTLVGWRDKVAEHENKLASILTVHTEESIPARQQRELLAFALEKLKAEEATYTQSVYKELEMLRRREALLQQQVDEISQVNRQIPELYQKVSVLDIEINANRELLSDLQGKWGEVRMSAMSDDRVSQVMALTAPELVMVIGGSKTAVYFFMVIFLALALGVVAAFVQDGLDHRVYGVGDIESGLNLPVFASISKAD